MAEILEFDPSAPNPHNRIDSMNQCLALYNKLSYEERVIVGMALLSPLPIDNVKASESNPITDFMKAYYELSELDQTVVFTAILLAPPDVNIVLGIGVPWPTEED